jgi:hypothetical protein
MSAANLTVASAPVARVRMTVVVVIALLLKEERRNHPTREA